MVVMATARTVCDTDYIVCHKYDDKVDCKWYNVLYRLNPVITAIGDT